MPAGNLNATVKPWAPFSAFHHLPYCSKIHRAGHCFSQFPFILKDKDLYHAGNSGRGGAHGAAEMKLESDRQCQEFTQRTSKPHSLPSPHRATQAREQEETLLTYSPILLLNIYYSCKALKKTNYKILGPPKRLIPRDM